MSDSGGLKCGNDWDGKRTFGLGLGVRVRIKNISRILNFFSENFSRNLFLNLKIFKRFLSFFREFFFQLWLALNLPVMCVVTKIDMTPPNVMKETLSVLGKLLRSSGVRKLPLLVQEQKHAGESFFTYNMTHIS